MNDQLQKALADILSLLAESAKTLGTAAQQEVPVLVQEYLAWGFWSAALMLTLWLTLGGALHFAAFKIRRIEVKKWAFEPQYGSSGVTTDGHDMKVMFGYFVLPIVGSLCIVFGGLSNIYTMLKITVAPRVYLLDTVIQAIK